MVVGGAENSHGFARNTRIGKGRNWSSKVGEWPKPRNLSRGHECLNLFPMKPTDNMDRVLNQEKDAEGSWKSNQAIPKRIPGASECM